MNARPTLTCDEIRDLAPLFVTGALDADEMDAVREHLADCEDAHAELEELGEAATALLETVEPVLPPAALKGRLMAAAEADLAEGRHPSAPVPERVPAPTPVAPSTADAPVSAPPLAPIAPAERGAAPVVNLDLERAKRRSRFAWVLAVAAVIAAVALGGWNIALRQDLSSAQAYRSGVEQALDLAAQPGSVTALIRAEDGSASGFGVIGSDGTARLALRGMAPTTGTEVYTAWSIAEGAAPVSMGDFSVGSDGIAVANARAPEAAPGLVMAITLEPNAGNTAPTGPVIASGVTRDPAG
jgi:anti-sigma-K factor RskA